MTQTYETIYICPGELSQEKVDASLEKVKAIIARGEGKIKAAELWGRRKLAYPIDRYRDGFYVYLLFSADAKTPSALEHHYRVTDTILRGLTVSVDQRFIDKVRPVVQTAPLDSEAQGGAQPVSAPEAQAPAAPAPSAAPVAPAPTGSEA